MNPRSVPDNIIETGGEVQLKGGQNTELTVATVRVFEEIEIEADLGSVSVTLAKVGIAELVVKNR